MYEGIIPSSETYYKLVGSLLLWNCFYHHNLVHTSATLKKMCLFWTKMSVKLGLGREH